MVLLVGCRLGALPECGREFIAQAVGRSLQFVDQWVGRYRDGTMTRVWAKVGTWSKAIRQTQYDYLYVFAAVCPETGSASGQIAPEINTAMMNAFLKDFGRELPADVHAVMVLDRAGWHVAKALQVPPNVTLVHLPPKSPELNPAENLWHYLRSHYWSNRLYKTWADLKDAAVDGWRRVCLLPEKIKTVCADTALRGIQS